MRHLVHLLLIALLAASLLSEKPAGSDKQYTADETVAIFATSLADTIPVNLVNELAIGNPQGIRMIPLRGTEVRYFEYTCDPNLLMGTLSRIPINILDGNSDLAVREVSGKIFIKPTQRELMHAATFWSASDSYKAYEIIKGPIKHELLVDWSSNRILHRVIYG